MARIGSLGEYRVRTLREAERPVQGDAPDHRELVELLVRTGYATKGVLYCTVGLFATMTVLGARAGADHDPKGALEVWSGSPFGRMVFVLTTVGLAAYALWSVACALWDPEGEARRKRADPLCRIGWLVSGVVHAALMLFAVGLLTGDASGHGDEAKSWSARVMAWPLGSWIVGLAGIVVTWLALRRVYQA